jgi:hypothetical protein
MVKFMRINYLEVTAFSNMPPLGNIILMLRECVRKVS